MIIFSQAFVLAPGAVPLNTPIFGWRNLVTTTNLTATTSQIANPVGNLANASTALWWEGADGSPADDTYLTVALSQVDPVDYVGIAGHNFGSAQIPVSLELNVFAGSPLAATWVEVVAPRLLANDDPLIMRCAPTSVIGGMRVRLQPGDELPRAAVLYAGKLLVMPRGTGDDHVPINLGRTRRRMRATSQAGHLLGDLVLSESRQSAIGFKYLESDWYLANFDPFIKAAPPQPFFFAQKPHEWPAEVGYCSLSNDPQPARDFTTQRFMVDLQLEGAAV